MAALGAAAYRFGAFLVDRVGYRVLLNDRPVEISPKLLDLLLHLLDNAGALVTKEASARRAVAGRQRHRQRAGPGRLRAAPGAWRRCRVARGSSRPSRVAGTASSRRSRPSHAAPAAPTAGLAALTIGSRRRHGLHQRHRRRTRSRGCLRASPRRSPRDLRALGRFRVVDRGRVIEAVRAARRRAARGRRRAPACPSPSSAAIQRNGDRIRITARIVNVGSGEALADAKVDGRVDDIFELAGRGRCAVLAGARRCAGPIADRRDRETPSLEAYRAFTEGWLRLETLDIRETAASHRELRARDRDRSPIRARVYRPRQRAAGRVRGDAVR